MSGSDSFYVVCHHGRGLLKELFDKISIKEIRSVAKTHFQIPHNWEAELYHCDRDTHGYEVTKLLRRDSDLPEPRILHNVSLVFPTMVLLMKAHPKTMASPSIVASPAPLEPAQTDSGHRTAGVSYAETAERLSSANHSPDRTPLSHAHGPNQPAAAKANPHTLLGSPALAAKTRRRVWPSAPRPQQKSGVANGPIETWTASPTEPAFPATPTANTCQPTRSAVTVSGPAEANAYSAAVAATSTSSRQLDSLTYAQKAALTPTAVTSTHQKVPLSGYGGGAVALETHRSGGSSSSNRFTNTSRPGYQQHTISSTQRGTGPHRSSVSTGPHRGVSTDDTSSRSEDNNILSILGEDDDVRLRRLLKSNKIQLPWYDELGRSLLMLCLEHHPVQTRCFEFLLAHDQLDHMDRYSRSAMTMAIVCRRLDLVTQLLDSGASPDTGLPAPLLQALDTKQDDIAEVLVYKGARLDCSDENGNKPLHLAVLGRLPNTVDITLTKGADPNVFNMRGDTPLHMAIKTRQEMIVRYLLEKKASVYHANNIGCRPIDLAAEASCPEPIRKLMNHSARTTIPEWFGVLPKELCIGIDTLCGNDQTIENALAAMLLHGGDEARAVEYLMEVPPTKPCDQVCGTVVRPTTARAYLEQVQACSESQGVLGSLPESDVEQEALVQLHMLYPDVELETLLSVLTATGFSLEKAGDMVNQEQCQRKDRQRQQQGQRQRRQQQPVAYSAAAGPVDTLAPQRPGRSAWEARAGVGGHSEEDNKLWEMQQMQQYWQEALPHVNKDHIRRIIAIHKGDVEQIQLALDYNIS